MTISTVPSGISACIIWPWNSGPGSVPGGRSNSPSSTPAAAAASKLSTATSIENRSGIKGSMNGGSTPGGGVTPSSRIASRNRPSATAPFSDTSKPIDLMPTGPIGVPTFSPVAVPVTSIRSNSGSPPCRIVFISPLFAVISACDGFATAHATADRKASLRTPVVVPSTV